MTGRDHLPGAQFEDDSATSAAQILARLEHDARYGRELAARLDDLMEAHRNGHSIDYAALLKVRGAA